MWSMFAPCSLARLMLFHVNILSIRACICVFVFILFFFKELYCTFYSVCNKDASDVCAIKITYLLTDKLRAHKQYNVVVV